MLRIGYVLPPYIGHLNPALALANCLREMGHQVVFVSTMDAEARIREARFPFVLLGAQAFPAGKWIEFSRQLGKLHGLRAADFTVRWLARFTRAILEDLPEVLDREMFEGCLVDQVAYGASSVCTSRRLSSVAVCHTLPLHFEPALPIHSSNRRFSNHSWTRFLNRVEQRLILLSGRRVFGPIAAFRRAQGLPTLTYHAMYHGEETEAQVCQLPAFLDFPRTERFRLVHTGPWITPQNPEDDYDFPWERLNGDPLVYASMGTLQNGVARVFKTLAEGCAGLPVQLVLSLGGNELPDLEHLPGAPIVVKYAPQRRLLRRASMAITHAGMNTALECATAGIPMVALPVTNDQPGVASRLAYHGLAVVIPVQQLTAGKLRAAVQQVLSDELMKLRLQRCAEQLANIKGPAQAAAACLSALGLRSALPEPGSGMRRAVLKPRLETRLNAG